jgi:F-type H+-transporting ATPase subunit b
VSIDLFTWIAQIVNFVILILLLKRFLFGRIIRAMDERRERISARMEDAVRKREEAERETETYRRMQRELNEQRASLIARAGEEAEARRREMLDEARREVEAEKARWRDALHTQEDAFYRSLRETIGTQVYHTARTVLADLADEDLNRRIIRTFLARVRGLDENGKREMRENAHISGATPIITSAAEISENLRGEIIAAVKEVLQTGADIRFERSPDILGGIELRIDGRKIAWSLRSYLDDLEENLAGILPGEQKEESLPVEA